MRLRLLGCAQFLIQESDRIQEFAFLTTSQMMLMLWGCSGGWCHTLRVTDQGNINQRTLVIKLLRQGFCFLP